MQQHMMQLVVLQAQFATKMQALPNIFFCSINANADTSTQLQTLEKTFKCTFSKYDVEYISSDEVDTYYACSVPNVKRFENT